MKIGFTNGCFDMFHEGHFHYLARCKEQCDWLIVALNSDESVTRLKGPGRPRWPWEQRLTAIIETDLVEAVIPFEGRWEKLVLEMRPDVVFQGAEYRKEGEEAVLGMRRVGWKDEGHGFDVVPIIYIERLPGFSTSLQIAALVSKTNA